MEDRREESSESNFLSNMWDCIPALTPMKPGTRLTKEQSNPSPDPAFHRRYRGIVGSLGYLVNMTRPDLAWSYSKKMQNASMGTAGTKALCGRARRGLEAAPGRGGRPLGR